MCNFDVRTTKNFIRHKLFFFLNKKVPTIHNKFASVAMDFYKIKSIISKTRVHPSRFRNMDPLKDLEEKNEEFDNFMYKVNEVNNIVKKLSSNDKNMQDIGTLEAEKYLNESKNAVIENLAEETVKLTITNDRTLINKKSLAKNDKDQATMSQGKIFHNFYKLQFLK